MSLEPHTNGNGRGVKPTWVPIFGQWEFAETGPTYRGEGHLVYPAEGSIQLGLAMSNVAMQTGICQVRIRFSGSTGVGNQTGGIVLGYRAPERHYIFARMGGGDVAFVIGERVKDSGWKPLVITGDPRNLRCDLDYTLQLKVTGQQLSMTVDGVPVLEHVLSHPLEGQQVGLLAGGNQPVSFSDFSVSAGRPRAFVVMHFAEPYDTFYRQVIQKQAEASGYEVFRIDEKNGPGVIFQDIQRGIEQAAVVIAEITPANPNVFYEVGYAHALGKPTILLAQRGAELPFDIRSFRVVFYNDTIGGKSEVDRSLHNHLEAVAGR